MDNAQPYSDEIHDRSTTELVEELAQHGKRLVQLEVRALREQLEGQLAHARDELHGSSGALLAEARERLGENLAALRRDLKDQVGRTTAAVKPMAIGSVIVHAGLFVLLAALVLGLATVMPAWVAALVVGVAAAAVGAMVLHAGKQKLELVGKDPLTRTHEQMTENRRWIDMTKETVATKLRAARAALSDVAWPKLPGSSGDARSRITSGNRLGAQ